MEIRSSDGFQVKSGRLYLNSLPGLHNLGVGFWTFVYFNPIYILRGTEGNTAIVQFDSDEFRNEWLTEHDSWKIEAVITKEGIEVNEELPRK